MHELLKYKNALVQLYCLFNYCDSTILQLENQTNLKWNEKEAIIFLKEVYASLGIILNFLPESPINSSFKCFSLSNLANIGRFIYENFHTVYYLLYYIDKNNEEAKKIVWEHHVDCKRLEILNIFGSTNPELVKLQEKVNSNKIVLEENQFIKSHKNRNKLIEGKTDRILDRKSVLNYTKLDITLLESTFKHFSQFSHSTSLASNQLKFDFPLPDDVICVFSTFINQISGLTCLTIMPFQQSFKLDLPIQYLSIFSFWEDFFMIKEMK